MSVAQKILTLKTELPANVCLVAVSKTHSKEKIEEALSSGHEHYGENRVQELVEKAEALPKTIKWHQIGHLQTNKVKYIAPFVHLIHAVDSSKLMKEIQKQGEKNNRIISGLLQVKIAQEETKYGFSFAELEKTLIDLEQNKYPNLRIQGLMGMASLVDDEQQIRAEFKSLSEYYKQHKKTFPDWKYLSMGMSGDYKIAIEEGSNMIRVGSKLFGSRN